MSRVNVALALILIACSLSLVNAQHHARKNFEALEQLKQEAKGLDDEWGQLRIEQGTWASASRVDALARTQLGMVTPPIDRIRVLTLPKP
jgi:cell division protein FtsL